MHPLHPPPRPPAYGPEFRSQGLDLKETLTRSAIITYRVSSKYYDCVCMRILMHKFLNNIIATVL